MVEESQEPEQEQEQERERESAHGRIRRKKPKEPLCHGRDLNPRPQSFEPSVLSTRQWRPSISTQMLEQLSSASA